MYESDMNEMLLIKRENEFMMEGKEVRADILDAHRIHIMEHRTVLADPELRMNPELRNMVQNHMQEHIDMLRTVDKDLLTLIGEQPLQNPQEAMMMAQQQGGMQQGQGGNIDPMMQAPQQGMPQPQDMIQGQGNPGGDMMPGIPKPPSPFENMPVQAQDMLPQS